MCFQCVVNGMTSTQATWLVQSSVDSNHLQAIRPSQGEVVNGVLVLYNASSFVRPGISNLIEAQCSAFRTQHTLFFVSKGIEAIHDSFKFPYNPRTYITPCNYNTVFVPPTATNVTVNEGEVLRISCIDDNPSGLGVTLSWQDAKGDVVSMDAVFTVREGAHRNDSNLIYYCVLTNAQNMTLMATVTITVLCKHAWLLSIYLLPSK